MLSQISLQTAHWPRTSWRRNSKVCGLVGLLATMLDDHLLPNAITSDATINPSGRPGSGTRHSACSQTLSSIVLPLEPVTSPSIGTGLLASWRRDPGLGAVESHHLQGGVLCEWAQQCHQILGLRVVTRKATMPADHLLPHAITRCHGRKKHLLCRSVQVAKASQRGLPIKGKR